MPDHRRLPPRYLRSPEAARFLGLSAELWKSIAHTVRGRLIASSVGSKTSKPWWTAEPRNRPAIPAQERSCSQSGKYRIPYVSRAMENCPPYCLR